MPDIKFATADVSAMKLGTTNVSKVMLGTVEVWPGLVCTDVLAEPFTNFTTNSWTLSSGPTIVAGRTGTCARVTSTFGRAAYTLPAPAHATTITAGFAYRWTDAVTGTRKIIELRSTTGTTLQNALRLTVSTGVLDFTRAGTVIATSAATGMVANTWYYLEVQAKLAAAPDGSVIVRVNGTPVINSTGQNTFVAGGGTLYDQFDICALVNTTVQNYDDLYISTGAGCAFQGDHTIP